MYYEVSVKPYIFFWLKDGQRFQIMYYEVSVKPLIFLLLKDGQRFQTIYYEVPNHWLCGQPHLGISLIFSSCLSLYLAADCKQIFGTISQVHAELRQHFPIRWHQFRNSLKLLVLFLRNLSKTGNFTNTAHIFHVFFGAYLYSAGTQHGNLHPAGWLILFCGPTQEYRN